MGTLARHRPGVPGRPGERLPLVRNMIVGLPDSAAPTATRKATVTFGVPRPVVRLMAPLPMMCSLRSGRVIPVVPDARDRSAVVASASAPNLPPVSRWSVPVAHTGCGAEQIRDGTRNEPTGPESLELGVDALQMTLDRSDAEVQVGSDRGVVAPGHQAQDPSSRAVRACTRVPPAPDSAEPAARKAVTSRRKTGHAGSPFEQDVVVALQWHQPRAGDPGRERSTVLEGVHPLVARVDDECGDVDVGQQVGRVGLRPPAP